MALSLKHCYSENATMRSAFIFQPLIIVNNIKMLINFLWSVYVLGNNKTHLGRHGKCPIFLSDFSQTFNFATDFGGSPQYQIVRKSV